MSAATMSPETILAWAETLLAPGNGCHVCVGWVTIVRNRIGQVSIWTDWDKATPHLVFVADTGDPVPVIRAYRPGPWVGQLAAVSRPAAESAEPVDAGEEGG